MAPDPRLEKLLTLWHQQRAQGRILSAAELCADCPELVSELRRMLQDLTGPEELPPGRTQPPEPHSSNRTGVCEPPEKMWPDRTRVLSNQGVIPAGLVDELLTRWQQLWEQGQNVTPEQLCANCPELIPELQRRLQGATQLQKEGPDEVKTVVDTQGTVPMQQAEAGPPLAQTISPGERSGGEGHSSLPGYEILGELGRGGMGVVYKARQVKLNRLVALKMILGGGLSSPEQVERFRTEAEAVARLQHPNIVQIHEIGDQNGLPFFSLEFVDGEALDRSLKGEPQGPREAALLVETLARSVHYAHQQQIVHRDLKPGNILMARDGTPKITDFGLAKKLDVVDSQTRSGTVMGTPSYMPPEQATGKVSPTLAPAVDIYSLGAILYELLTGRPPFRAATTLETLHQVVHEEPVPPSRLNSTVPRDLETICLKCLQKEPPRRYTSALDLAVDLRCFLDGQPIKARPVGWAERSWRWCRRNPAVASLVGALALSFLLGTVVSWWLALRAEHNARQARDNARQAQKQKQAADAARQDAEEARRRTEQELQRTEGLLYAARLNLAQGEWKRHNPVAAWDLLNGCRWDQRGWEHHYLYTLFTSNQRTFEGHNDLVLDVAFHPDGQHLASASQDKTIKIWHLGRGQVVRTLAGHSGKVASIAFHEGGKLLASGGGSREKQSGEIFLWDPTNGQKIRTLTGPIAPVNAVAFAGSDTRLLSGGGDEGQAEVYLWDLASGQKLLRFHGPTGPVVSVASSNDGQLLASGGGNRDGNRGEVQVWEAATNKLLWSLPHAGPVLTVAFSPDGRRLASAGQDRPTRGECKIWDVATGKLLHTLDGHTKPVWSVAFSADGQHLISASADYTIKMWDAHTGALQGNFQGHTNIVSSVAFSPDGRQLASGGWDTNVKIWDLKAAQPPITVQAHAGGIARVAYSPDGQLLASSGTDLDKQPEIKIWDLRTHQVLRAFPHPGGEAPDLAFHPQENILVTAGQSLDGTKGALRFWDIHTGKEKATRLRHDNTITCLAFSGDGQFLVAGSDDGTASVWAWKSASVVQTLAEAGPVYRVAISRDGHHIATVAAANDLCINLWERSTGKQRLTLRGHLLPVQSVAFSPDSRRLLSASDDRTLTLWDLTSGQELQNFKGHTDAINQALFMPDGNRLVSAGSHGLVKIWNVHSGLETLSLTGYGEPALSLACSPDGCFLVCASADGTFKLWDATRRQRVFTVASGTEPILQLVPSRDDLRLVSESDQLEAPGDAQGWDLLSGQRIFAFKKNLGLGGRVAINADGQRLAAGADKAVLILDGASGKTLTTLSAHTKPVRNLAINADGQWVVTGAHDKEGYEIKGWQTASGHVLVSIGSRNGELAGVAISPDGQRLAYAHNDPPTQRAICHLIDVLTGQSLSQQPLAEPLLKLLFTPQGRYLATIEGKPGKRQTLRLWNLASGQQTFLLKGTFYPVGQLAFSFDDQLLATEAAEGGNRQEVQVYDLTSGNKVHTLPGHSDDLLGLAFSRDGRRLASGSQDRTIKLWDLGTGRELQTFRGHDAKVTSVVFSHDGRRLFSGDWGGFIKLWPLP